MAVATGASNGKTTAATISAARPVVRFKSLSEVGDWVKRTQGNARRFALHIDLTSTFIEHTFRNSATKRLDRARATWKARRAVRQFRRAAAHMDAAADCMAKGWKDTMQQFAELINPQKARKDFDWEH